MSRLAEAPALPASQARSFLQISCACSLRTTQRAHGPLPSTTLLLLSPFGSGQSRPLSVISDKALPRRSYLGSFALCGAVASLDAHWIATGNGQDDLPSAS